MLKHIGRECYSEPAAVYEQARRGDPEALFAYLAEERIPASVNHLLSALTGRRALTDLRLPLAPEPG